MERGESSNQGMKYQYSRRPKSGTCSISTGKETYCSNPAGTPPIDEPNASSSTPAHLHMPISIVTRIIQKILPPQARISDKAKETIQECVTEFISFITSEANAKCNQEFRSTVTPEDVLRAMCTLGFDNYAETLTVYLNRHRAQNPNREPVPELEYWPDPPTIVQRQVAPPLPQPLAPPAPPEMMHRAYVPAVYDGNYYFPGVNNYFVGPMRRGGEGCSKDMEDFDPF